MIAPFTLPPEYAAWNRQWGAPFGRPGFARWPLRGTRFDVRRRGPFAYLRNNTIREFEYPWAYHQVAGLGPNQIVIEVGGGVGGLQFVLAAEGHRVTNVDPGLAAAGRGWELDPRLHRRLADCFRAPVALVAKPIQDAGLPDAQADAVVCVSALEHFSAADRDAAAEHIARVLRPGGVLVMTVDLFLDLAPFTDRAQNEFGRNVDLKEWLARAGLELTAGNRHELYGFDEFSPVGVLRNLARYHVGHWYPALAQCLVARKP
jgi:SAM-dependent methyltransferase